LSENGDDIIGIRKCKMLYYMEICLMFNAKNNEISMDYSVKEKKVYSKNKMVESMQEMVDIFGDVVDRNNYVEFDEFYDEEEDESLDDIDNWIDPESFDLFMNDKKVGNNYYDEMVLGQKENEPENKYDDDIQHRLRLFLGLRLYGMARNEAIFAEDLDLNVLPDHDIIDYVDSFVLEWNNENEWNQNDENNEKCNDVILSFVSYSICIGNGLIYFNKNGNDINYLYDDHEEGVKVFYEKTKFLIEKELNDTKLNMMNDREWTEIYKIFENGKEKKKLCHYVSMIKLCAESQSERHLLSNDFKITIQYLSDEESKVIIRRNKQIWSDSS